MRLSNDISDEKYDYPTRDQVILKCNINDSAFVISQVSPLRWHFIISENWNSPFGFADEPMCLSGVQYAVDYSLYNLRGEN